MTHLLIVISVFGVFMLSFAIVLYFLRASQIEINLQRQLDQIAETYRSQSLTQATILKEDKFSPSQPVHDFLRRIPRTRDVHRMIKQAGVSWWVSSVLLYASISVAGVFLLALLIWQSLMPAILFAAAAGLAPFAYLRLLRHKRRTACAKLLPDAVDLMTRALKAGHALNSALEMVSNDIAEPLSSEFRTVYVEQTLGLPLRDALTNLVERMPSDDMEFLTAALLLQRDTGGNLAHILEKTSALMKDRVRLRGQVRTQTAQARMSGWVLGGLPFFLFAILSFIDPAYESILLNDPVGIQLVYAGLAMLAVGILIIRKIVAIEL
jgi:tight adherence protein B